MHSCIKLYSTELGLPFQSDPLVRGSLNIRTICRLVVYLLHIVLVRFRGRFSPVHLVWFGSRLSCSCFIVRACSCHHVWRRKDGLIVDLLIMIFIVRMLTMFWFIAQALFIHVQNKWFIFLSNGFLAKPSCLMYYALVFRCRRRCLWGGVPGGGFWATLSPWVATRWRHLDVRRFLEMRHILLGLHFCVLGCISHCWPLILLWT